MSVTIAGTPLKKMTHNGQTVKKWVHDGVQVYSSELVLWDGSSGLEWSNAVSTPNAGAANGEGGIKDGRQYVRAWCGGSYFAIATRQCAVDLTGYNTLTITWTAASLGPNYNNQMYGVGVDLNTNWIYPGSQDISTASNVGMYTQTQGTVTFDVSGLTGVHSIGCRAQSPNGAAGDVYVYISSAVLT